MRGSEDSLDSSVPISLVYRITPLALKNFEDGSLELHFLPVADCFKITLLFVSQAGFGRASNTRRLR